MKRMHRIFAMLLAVIMIAAFMAVPVSAEGTTPTYTITVAGTATGHTFEAYQVFSGVLEGTILTEVQWGSGVDAGKEVDGKTLIQALNALPAYKDAKNASDVAAKLNGANAEAGLEFAGIINKYLSNTKQDTGEQIGPNYTISGLTTGYYLIKDKDGSLSGKENESYTDFILSLSKDTVVNPKSGHPTVSKRVSESGLVNTYFEWVTQSIGSQVHFDITGTLTSELPTYNTYFYQFNDTMTPGLTYDAGSLSVTRIDGDNHSHVIDPACYSVVVSPYSEETGTKLSVTFENLLSVTSGGQKLTINRSDKIMVHYTATLNENSLIGLDNPDENEVYITYSNNPNTNDKGNTNTVDVDVYTFGLRILKVDSLDHTKVLQGAEFILYRTISDVTTYAKAEKNEEGVYKISGWVSAKTEATPFITGENGMVRISGLKAGGFFVEETKAPSGYNKLTDPLAVWIQVQEEKLKSTEAGVEKVTASVGNASVTVDAGAGVVTATVENAGGTILPSTGGIGTTIFYIVGGILVCGAAVLLISKKRMANNA